MTQGNSSRFKFRAWDKETKEMSYDFLSKNWLRVCVESPYVELMQYTGLKDKNGKDIYEGDIFEAPHDFGPGGFDVRRTVVRFHEMHGYQWNYWLTEQLEVIGNIFENPELLKGNVSTE